LIENDAIAILKEVKTTLDDANITFWLDVGTLLGAVRDNRFIEHDHDIDIGFWFRDIKKVEEELKKLDGYIYEYREGNLVGVMKDDIEVEFIVLNPNIFGEHVYECIMPIHIVGRFLDQLLWMVRLNNSQVKKNYGGVLSVEMMNKFVKIFSVMPFREKLERIIDVIYHKIDSVIIESAVPVKYFQELKTIKLYDMDFCIPEQFDEYLTFRYGDWREPQRDYVGGAVVKKYRYGGVLIDEKHIWRG